MADIAKPLYDLLDKDGKKIIQWTSEATAPHLPDVNRPFVLVTDASTVGTVQCSVRSL